MASTLFNGASRYTQDFSAVIERSVGIASLALRQMQQAREKSNNEITALRNLKFEIGNIQSTLKSLEDSVGANSVQTTSSNSSAVLAKSAAGVGVGSYRLTVVSLGAYSTAVGKTSVQPITADPNAAGWVDSGTTELTLRITDHTTETPSSTDTTINLAGATSLQGVVNAINSAGAPVQAAVVNVGTTAQPNYTITLQSTQLGKLALQLKEGATDLLDVNEANAIDPSLGSLAQYKINGATVNTDSRSITLAPKLTADLLKADSGQEILVEVKAGTNSVTSALNAFIRTYNTAVDEIDKMTAKNGALLGNSLAAGIRHQLRNAVSQGFPGDFTSLARIGVEFTSEGKLRLNNSLFEQETAGKFDALKSLIGTSSGTGFVRALTNALDSISASSGAGFLNGAISSLETSLAAEDRRIAAETSRVEQFTKDLQERLAKADAMIAQLEQQASYFADMFKAMRVNQESFK